MPCSVAEPGLAARAQTGTTVRPRNAASPLQLRATAETVGHWRQGHRFLRANRIHRPVGAWRPAVVAPRHSRHQRDAGRHLAARQRPLSQVVREFVERISRRFQQMELAAVQRGCACGSLDPQDFVPTRARSAPSAALRRTGAAARHPGSRHKAGKVAAFEGRQGAQTGRAQFGAHVQRSGGWCCRTISRNTCLSRVARWTPKGASTWRS